MEKVESSTNISAAGETMKATIRNFKGITYDVNDPKFEGLSKKRIKRLLRDEKWNENKEERKLAMRERTKQKRTERRQKIREGIIEKPPTKKKLAHYSELVNIDLVIDCSFNELMTEKELVSFVKQLSYGYGRNRVAPKAMKMMLTSFDDTLEKVMDEKLPSWRQWKEDRVSIKPTSYLEHFDKENLVYLSADSDNVIETLEEGKAYIVGGIVDKNRYKNLCQDKATNEQIKTARLPIGDYLKLSTRKVLTVNQVCEIMSKWLELGDWQEAFLKVIPDRKLKVVKLVEENSD